MSSRQLEKPELETAAGLVLAVEEKQPGFFVGSFREEKSGETRKFICGDLFISPGYVVTFSGHWTHTSKYGRQFRAKSVNYDRLELCPDGLRILLTRMSEAVGIGPKKAALIVDRFGVEFETVLLERPEEIAEVAHVPEEFILELAGHWKEHRQQLTCFAGLLGFGLTMRQCQSIFDAWGLDAVIRIREQPYGIAAIEGIGFKTADAIAARLGIAKDSPERIRAGLLYDFEDSVVANGSTCCERRDLLFSTAERLGLHKSVTLVEKGLAELVERKNFVLHDKFYTTPFYLLAEKEIGEFLTELWEPHPYIRPDQIDALADKHYQNLTPDADQIDAVKLAMRHRGCLITGGAGCLAAGTIINVNRAGKGFQMPIEKVVGQFNGTGAASFRKDIGREVLMPPWDSEIPTSVARADGGVVRLAKLKNAWCSGEKETFVLTTDSGRSIRATEIHPFLTENGIWKQLGQLRLGDILQVNIGRSGKGPEPKLVYRYVATRFHPGQVKNSNERDRWKVLEHRAVVEAEMNGLTLKEFLWVVRYDRNKASGLKYLLDSEIVHHKNRDTLDNSLCNLKVVNGAKAHSEEHDSWRNVLWQVGFETVVSIEPYGREMTYDLEVEDDPHNFLANGFVVHNTGKTTIIRVLLSIFRSLGMHVSLCAPTGKAAKRMEEAASYPAMTMHRLLQYHPKHGWQKNPSNPIDSDVIIGDEQSMSGASLFWYLIRAIRKPTCLILVGDHHQLPPVEPGAILRDCTEKTLLPTKVLGHCHRQAGTLRKNCAAILPGRLAQTEIVKPPARPSWVVEDKHDNPEDAAKRIVDIYTRFIPDRLGRNPQTDCQVLVPQNKDNPLSTGTLNVMLQAAWHYRNGVVVPDWGEDKPGFVAGDRVIQTRNNYDLEIMNGHQGIVVTPPEKGRSGPGMSVQWEGLPLPMMIPPDKVSDISLSYALTPHKAQGSEWPIVIVAVHSCNWFMLHRGWLYTSATRAREKLYLIGNSKGMADAVKKIDGSRRRTLLTLLAKANPNIFDQSALDRYQKGG